MLATVLHGDPVPGQVPLLIAHGLYGSARNWNVIAKRLSDRSQVIAVDMRNHGSSPRTETHRYPELAEDLAEVIAAHGGRADVLGHSMGGKAAMTLAVTQPSMLRKLIVADIAPVAYQHSQLQYAKAMQALDLSDLETRTQADKAFAESVPDHPTRAFLLQSLDLKSKTWRLNLETLAREMDNITGFVELDSHFDGPTLFLSGGASDYVTQEHRPEIRRLFPHARFVKLPGAGHWLHAEKPKEFEATVRAFLDA